MAFNTAQYLATRKPYCTREEIEQHHKGVWNNDFACWDFPDGSSGRFTDIRQGAAMRDGFGNPVAHFITVASPDACTDGYKHNFKGNYANGTVLTCVRCGEQR